MFRGGSVVSENSFVVSVEHDCWTLRREKFFCSDTGSLSFVISAQLKAKRCAQICARHNL